MHVVLRGSGVSIAMETSRIPGSSQSAECGRVEGAGDSGHSAGRNVVDITCWKGVSLWIS